MKTTLILAAAVALMATAAGAVEMPEQLGFQSDTRWCETKLETKGGWQVVRMTPLTSTDKCKNISDFVVGADEFGWEDEGCVPVHVGRMQVKPPRDRTLEWAIRARCEEYGSGHAVSKIREFKFSLYQGTYLTLYTKRGR